MRHEASSIINLQQFMMIDNNIIIVHIIAIDPISSYNSSQLSTQIINLIVRQFILNLDGFYIIFLCNERRRVKGEKGIQEYI